MPHGCWADESCKTTARIKYFIRGTTAAHQLDKNKNTAIKRSPCLILKPLVQTALLFMRVKNGMRPTGIGALAAMFEKSATELKLNQKLLRHKSTIQIVTFNVRTLNSLGQLPELTASAIDHNIDIICIQKQRYLHSKI